MDAEAALKAYRKATDPRIKAGVAAFKKLPPSKQSELLYYMICNTNLLVSAGGETELVPQPNQPKE